MAYPPMALSCKNKAYSLKYIKNVFLSKVWFYTHYDHQRKNLTDVFLPKKKNNTKLFHLSRHVEQDFSVNMSR